MDRVRTGKFLSLILRHRPEVVGIDLDREGWADVAALLAGMQRKGHPLTLDELVSLVETNDKRRYAFSSDGRRIRAVQGHSRPVDVGLAVKTPPTVLFHGTVQRFVPSIRDSGLIPGSRQYVHLSSERTTAVVVGKRRGTAVVLTIDAAAMATANHVFYLLENGVWLTEGVPARFIIAWE